MRSAGPVLAVALLGSLGSIAVLGADLDEIRRRGELRVAAIVDNPADEFFTDQPGVGLDRELIEKFGELQKLKVTVVPASSWDRLVPMVLEGKADVAAGRLTVTEGRRRLVAFTQEVFPSRAVVVTRAPAPVISSIEDLRQAKVGTVRGTSLAEAVAGAKVPASRIVDTIPTGALPEALRDGRASAVVLGIEMAISERRRDPALQLGMLLGPPGALAWAVRKEDTALLGALDSFIGGLRHSPVWSRVVVKYFGSDAPEILRKTRSEGGP